MCVRVPNNLISPTKVSQLRQHFYVGQLSTFPTPGWCSAPRQTNARWKIRILLGPCAEPPLNVPELRVNVLWVLVRPPPLFMYRLRVFVLALCNFIIIISFVCRISSCQESELRKKLTFYWFTWMCNLKTTHQTKNVVNNSLLGPFQS